MDIREKIRQLEAAYTIDIEKLLIQSLPQTDRLQTRLLALALDEIDQLNKCDRMEFESNFTNLLSYAAVQFTADEQGNGRWATYFTRGCTFGDQLLIVFCDAGSTLTMDDFRCTTREEFTNLQQTYKDFVHFVGTADEWKRVMYNPEHALMMGDMHDVLIHVMKKEWSSSS